MATNPSKRSSLAHIGFGTVRHRRLRPRGNSFRYPAFFLNLPLRGLDEALSGTSFVRHNRFGLMGFFDRDHGARDGGALISWIEALLAREGIDDADGEIWLQTFPRVLGYVFNPVSFWFCEKADGSLRAVLVEVNNTFGEQHCYLLAHSDGSVIRNGEELSARKAFHVSPFCTLEGGYRFRFLKAAGRCVARIDYDDASGPLLLTSVSGALRILDDRSALRAFVQHPLFTFLVVARIHWQAVRLFCKRLPFFSKPPRPAVEVTR